MQATTHKNYNSPAGKMAWQLATRMPAPGEWEEEEYLALDPLLEDARSVELVDGSLEFLPMPTKTHELIVAFLYEAMRNFVRGKHLGEVYFSGRRVKLSGRLLRLPDIIFVLAKHKNRSEENYTIGADLVMEVVSGSAEDHERDYIRKRREYAKAGIAEYWIVDPQQKQITVFALQGKSYKVHGQFAKGETAGSFVLPGFEVDVSETLAGLKQ